MCISHCLKYMEFDTMLMMIISTLFTRSKYFYSADYALNDGADEELQMMAVCSVMFRQFQ